MNSLLVAQVLLLAGAAACLLPMRNGWRAAAGLASQGAAMVLVLGVALPVAFGGDPVQGEQAWAHPVGTLKVRLDALGAFFLAWSLPMTLLGSVYAVGYLRRHFSSKRHVVEQRKCVPGLFPMRGVVGVTTLSTHAAK